MLETVWSFVGWGVSLTRPVVKSVWSFVGWGVSFTRPVLECIWSFCGWGVSLTRPVLKSVRRIGSLLFVPYWNLSGHYLGGDFLLHAPCWNLSGRTSRGMSILLAPCWNLSGRTSGGKSILLAPSWHLSRRSASEVSLLYASCWNVFIGLGVSLTRHVLESFSLSLLSLSGLSSSLSLSLARFVLSLSICPVDQCHRIKYFLLYFYAGNYMQRLSEKANDASALNTHTQRYTHNIQTRM